MSSDESEIDSECTPPHLKAEAELAKTNLLPPKSSDRYNNNYQKFITWKKDKQAKSWSENIFLAYFNHLSLKMKPSSLWSVYSMLKAVVLTKQGINLQKYTSLTAWLKRQSDGYQCKKSKVLTSENVQQFLNDAPDKVYLVEKVVLIMGINGACRAMEIVNLTTKDVEYHDEIIVVKLKETKIKVDRTFVIRDEFVTIVKKYGDLRPNDVQSDKFFINYKDGKCLKQNIGRHKIAAMPKKIATYLQLPDPEAYTGHCFRRSSATLLADKEKENKKKITSKINKNIRLHPYSNPQPSTSRQDHQIINEHSSPSPQPPKQDEGQTASPQPLNSRHENELQNTPAHSLNLQAATSQVNSEIQQTNISMPGKTITISITNCPNTNLTFNIT